jgi:hypothetical protein
MPPNHAVALEAGPGRLKPYDYPRLANSGGSGAQRSRPE